MELIDREEAKREFNAGFGGVSHAVAAGHILDSIEAIDPVHAAGGCYCHECRYFEPVGMGVFDSNNPPEGYGRCDHPDFEFSIECSNDRLTTRMRDFCSHGKPKE